MRIIVSNGNACVSGFHEFCESCGQSFVKAYYFRGEGERLFREWEDGYMEIYEYFEQ